MKPKSQTDVALAALWRRIGISDGDAARRDLLAWLLLELDEMPGHRGARARAALEAAKDEAPSDDTLNAIGGLFGHDAGPSAFDLPARVVKESLQALEDALQARRGIDRDLADRLKRAHTALDFIAEMARIVTSDAERPGLPHRCRGCGGILLAGRRSLFCNETCRQRAKTRRKRAGVAVGGPVNLDPNRIFDEVGGGTAELIERDGIHLKRTEVHRIAPKLVRRKKSRTPRRNPKTKPKA